MKSDSKPTPQIWRQESVRKKTQRQFHKTERIIFPESAQHNGRVHFTMWPENALAMEFSNDKYASQSKSIIDTIFLLQ